MIGIAVIRFLQMIEATENLKSFLLIQDGTSIPFRYFFLNTELHRPSPKSPLQHDFAARERENHFKFHKPQPPFSFGSAIFCHLLGGNRFVFWHPSK
jgi:hypothetical protein